MRKYVLKRLALALLTLFVILSLTFILMKLLPFQKPAGFPASQWAFYQDQIDLGYVIQVSEENAALGTLLWHVPVSVCGSDNVYLYQASIMDQYFNWIGNIFTKWDWGTSTSVLPNYSAMYIIAQKLPVSISINIISVIIAVPFGILLGIWAALKKNKLTDHIISTLVMVFISVPSFVIISLLMLWLCYENQWLPSQWPLASMSSGQKALGYIIPVVSLSFGSICGYCRFTRAELCEVMSSDYLLLARTKGLTRRQSIVRHALRNAMVPIVPSIIAEFIGILGGSMILESLYGIPGIGGLFIECINKKDYNVLMVDMAVFTMISLAAGVLLDISYGFIDPRIRMGAKK
jgi:oligopeptide transport system permease protein